MNPWRGARVFVAGHRGLLGSALVRELEARGCGRILLAERARLDLEDAAAVDTFFARERPDYVFCAAAHVGGIVANRERPADFIRRNLAIELALIPAAARHGAAALVFFGSSCMYPRRDDGVLRESDLWGGPLEATSRPYAVAKLAGVELCEAYRRQSECRFATLVPATLYGPGDHFGSERAHVIPALIERFVAAREGAAQRVEVFGSGRARREFLYVDDAARAALRVAEHVRPDEEHALYNAGSGEEVTIAELAQRVAAATGYDGEIAFDPGQPEGALRKCLVSDRLRALGWTPRVTLDEGLAQAVAAFEAKTLRATG